MENSLRECGRLQISRPRRTCGTIDYVDFHGDLDCHSLSKFRIKFAHISPRTGRQMDTIHINTHLHVPIHTYTCIHIFYTLHACARARPRARARGKGLKRSLATRSFRCRGVLRFGVLYSLADTALMQGTTNCDEESCPRPPPGRKTLCGELWAQDSLRKS